MGASHIAFPFNLCIALLLCNIIAAASAHLRAAARNQRRYALGGGCQFVAHRPDDSEAVLAAEGPQVLFRKGEVVVVEDKPMRYLVSLAEDGTCNEQAEQRCEVVSGNKTSAGSCETALCKPEGNGDSLLSYLRSMAGALVARPPPARSLVLGLGSGALASWLGRAFPDGSVDAVDLNADVIAAAQCFGVQSSSQVNVVQSEGRAFLRDAGAFAYDAIFLDAFDAAGLLPPCLATSEFFALVAQKLAPDQGVLAVNLGARDDAGPVLAAIRKAFIHVAVGHAPLLTNHLVLASQTPLTLPSEDTGAAEVLAPDSVAANVTRWARQAGYKASQPSTQDAPRTDAGEGCAAASPAA